MRMTSLLATQRVLLVNWIVGPALGLSIWVKAGFFNAVLFVIIWLIADRVWDRVSGLLTARVCRIKASRYAAFGMKTSGEVPGHVALMMIVDLLGTVTLPWIVAGFFLGWFGSARSLSSTAAREWWMAEYPALIRAVEAGSERSLSANYRTGPGGEAEVKVILIRGLNKGLTVKLTLPPQAILSVDSKTGERIPSSVSSVITIRDHNQDGIPDDFDMEPSGELLYEETITEDGFVRFRNGSDHEAIWAQWSIAIGYSVNHFLHGVESALPGR